MSTQPGGRPVDIDTLADYIEGLLPAEEISVIDDLVANDPAWASTLAALRSAQPKVAMALSGYAADTPPIPADIAADLDHLIRTLDRPSNVVDLSAHKSRRSSRRPRIWLEAAAVFIVVVVGGGLLFQLGLGQSSSDAKSSTTAVAGGHGAAQSRPATSGLSVTASGKDYAAGSLGNVTPAVPFPTHANSSRAPAIRGGTPGGLPAADAVPSGLRRLLDPVAFNECVNAIETATGGTATSADFATYQHRPALVVELATINTTIAVGPTCGEPGVGIDELGRN